MTSPKISSHKVIHFFTRALLAILVFFLLVPWFQQLRFDLSLQVNARVTGDDFWTVIYDYGFRKHKLSHRQHQESVFVKARDDFQVLSFPLPKNPRIKTIRIVPGKKPGKAIIQWVRLKALGAEYRWENPPLILGPGMNKNQDIFSLYDQVRNDSRRLWLLKIPAFVLALLVFWLLGFVISRQFPNLSLTSLRFSSNLFWLSLIFIFIIVIPFLFHVIGPYVSIDNAEKRSLAPPPAIQFNQPWDFPSQYQTYFNDHFPFRDAFIRLNNRVKVKWFRVSPVPKVIVGKSSWLFYHSELANDGNTIQDYQGQLLYTPDQLQLIEKNIQKKVLQCQRQGAYLLVVLVPNKETIYPEFMPDHIQRGVKTRLDQLSEYFKARPHLPVLILTEHLLEKKAERLIYYQGGTHWNQYGAFFAYEKIIKHLSCHFPGLEPYPVEAFDIKMEENSAYDHWFGFREHCHYTFRLKDSVSRSNKNSRQTYKAVFFRDSFIQYFPHFYQYHFNPFVEESNHEYNHQVIKQKKPDIVIWEVIERSSHLLLPKK